MNTHQRLLSALALSVALAALLVMTFVRPARAESALGALDGSANLPVEFTDCVESIGVTLVPTASVRVYVPHQFILAGEGQPVTPLVVRTVRCSGIATAGHNPTPGEIVQIGAVIVPPDFTGDINNYTIWYYTSNLHLALRLVLAGVRAQYVPTIDYDYQTADNSFDVRVPLPGMPRLALSGTVNPSPLPAGSFVANWWQATWGGSLKMSTNVPVINIGGADLAMTTDLRGPLGQLLGTSATGFPIIQQFNTFGAAHMQVALAP